MAAALLGLDGLFLGFDSSTQSLKATVVDSSLRIVTTESLQYDTALPHYQTSGGVHRASAEPDSRTSSSGSALRVTAPPAMWVEAFDVILTRLKDADFPFDKVRAVSGSGQQHGSVYWQRGARARLANLRSDRTLFAQLCGDERYRKEESKLQGTGEGFSSSDSIKGASLLDDASSSVFSLLDSPIWMDSSTASQCREIEAALSGPAALARMTGSRAYERFTGPQVRRVWQHQPREYENTERISLVSSFGASLLVGDYAPIDAADGAGMNLMDLRTREWADVALEATAPNLRERLGEVVPSHEVVGNVHGYYVERFGFSPTCQVVAWSGDNPCSLAGLALGGSGDVGISLGTSDTVFAVVQHPQPGLEGHVFPNPVDPSSFMAMICYKNGSFTRQAIRDRCAGGSWESFCQLLNESPPLNGGRMGLYYLDSEIIPPLPVGTHRYAPKQGDGSAVSEAAVRGPLSALTRLDPDQTFSPPEEIRALVEGQLAAMRGHAERIGLQSPPARIIATGGGSANEAILRTMANVFGCPVYTSTSTDSASLGAALRAAHGYLCHAQGSFVPFTSLLDHASATSATSSSASATAEGATSTAPSAVSLSKAIPAGSPDLHARYGEMVARRMAVEQQLLDEARGQQA
ncbi:hypothetical protein CLOM_g1218 [Closterium sp. NIES-68]|nr:hypothetical protein CLOM_g1218 [Closterium sp. NIES-68]GJP71427.1 hypothetical protein CLOP_g2253 [Closterium sp. NIES-67]